MLEREGLLTGGIPPLPARAPRHDDDDLGVSFFRTQVEGKLEQLTLPRTFFARSEIRNCSFRGTDLSESTANWNDFIDVDFSGADLARCDLRGCTFASVRFTGTCLAGADLRHCSFERCDVTGADMAGAKLTEAGATALGISPDQRRAMALQADDGEEPEGG